MRSRIAAGLAAAMLAGLGSVVAAPAAHAVSTCNTVFQPNDATDPGARLRVPAYRSSSGSYTMNCVLQYGNSGSAVVALQMALNYCYGARLNLDGSFGRLTKAALINAQNRVNVEPDGVFGPITSRAIRYAGVNEITDRVHCGSRR